MIISVTIHFKYVKCEAIVFVKKCRMNLFLLSFLLKLFFLSTRGALLDVSADSGRFNVQYCVKLIFWMFSILVQLYLYSA